MSPVVREVRTYRGHTIEPLTVRQSEMRPITGAIYLPNRQVDVFRVDDLRDFEIEGHAMEWIDGGHADREKEHVNG